MTAAAEPPPLIRVGDDFEREYPTAERSATEAYVNLIRTAEQLSGELGRRLRAEVGLSITAHMVLAIVEGAGEPIPAGQIAQRAVITSASVTSLLDTLERSGLLERRADPDDRRRVMVAVTGAGRDLLDATLPGIRDLERKVLSPLDEAERATLLGLLGRIQARAAEVAAAPPALPPGPRHKRP